MNSQIKIIYYNYIMKAIKAFLGIQRATPQAPLQAPLTNLAMGLQWGLAVTAHCQAPLSMPIQWGLRAKPHCKSHYQCPFNGPCAPSPIASPIANAHSMGITSQAPLQAPLPMPIQWVSLAKPHCDAHRQYPFNSGLAYKVDWRPSQAPLSWCLLKFTHCS